jgi:hypothetical protein
MRKASCCTRTFPSRLSVRDTVQRAAQLEYYSHLARPEMSFLCARRTQTKAGEKYEPCTCIRTHLCRERATLHWFPHIHLARRKNLSWKSARIFCAERRAHFRQCALLLLQHPRLPFKNAPGLVFIYVRARNQRLLSLFFHAYISRKKLKGRAYANKISSLMNARRRKNNGADKKSPEMGLTRLICLSLHQHSHGAFCSIFLLPRLYACMWCRRAAQEQLRQTWIIIRRQRTGLQVGPFVPLWQQPLASAPAHAC